MQVYRFTVEGISVAFGAFDTAWRSGTEDDRGNLILGVDQLQEFLAASSEAEFRIAAFHHPTDWLSEFDSIPVNATLQEAGVLVLTGHEHHADPKLEVSPKGSTLYSRTACAFEKVGYPNGYTVLDIDLDCQATEVQLRRWDSSEASFLPDPRAGATGCARFEWPAGEGAGGLITHRLPMKKVLEPLVSLAQEQSVLAESITQETPTYVSDLVVSPRFWPVPHREVYDRSIEDLKRPTPVDALDAIAGNRVLIVSGPRMSGVSTSILWILERHLLVAGTHIPAMGYPSESGSRLAPGPIG